MPPLMYRLITRERLMEAVIFPDEQEASQDAPRLGIAKVGHRIRATVDWYPARAGAIGRILRIEGLSEDRRVIVLWEDPDRNLASFAQSDLHIYDMEYFEDVPPREPPCGVAE